MYTAFHIFVRIQVVYELSSAEKTQKVGSFLMIRLDFREDEEFLFPYVPVVANIPKMLTYFAIGLTKYSLKSVLLLDNLRYESDYLVENFIRKMNKTDLVYETVIICLTVM